MTMELARRTLLARVGVGLGGGVLVSVLSACGPAASVTPTTVTGGGATPTSIRPTNAVTTALATAPAPTGTASSATGTRGSGGTIRVLMWQGPTILNGHLSQGTKDYIAARFCCEPLLTVSADGVFSPILVPTYPQWRTAGLSAGGRTVT